MQVFLKDIRHKIERARDSRARLAESRSKVGIGFTQGQAAFRESTEEGHAKMPGVTMPSFKCPKCKQFRAALGRKKINGFWRCKHCLE